MKIRQHRVTAFLLAVVFAFAILPQAASAEETYGYEVVVNPSLTAIGSEVTLTVRLTDYNENKSGIRGFQIDITNSGDLLQNAECTSLVKDTENLLSNAAKYQPSRDIVRHLYSKLSGTMDYSETDLLEVKIPIPDTFTEAGTVTFPFRILIQNEAGEKLTYESTVEVRYAPASEIPDESDVSAEITWGSMEFTYTDGIWNPQTHSYDNAGWSDDGTGCVTVENTGKADTTVRFAYDTDRSDIAGSFTDGVSQIIQPVVLASGEKSTAYLILSGKPDNYLDEHTAVGTVTVTIGGE